MRFIKQVLCHSGDLRRLVRASTLSLVLFRQSLALRPRCVSGGSALSRCGLGAAELLECLHGKAGSEAGKLPSWNCGHACQSWGF